MGTATAQYVGKPKTVNIAVMYFDENDGKSKFSFYVNDSFIDEWTADKDLGFDGANTDTLCQRVIENVVINTGDIIKITGKNDRNNEKARIDKIELVQLSETSSKIILLDDNGEEVMSSDKAKAAIGKISTENLRQGENILLIMGLYNEDGSLNDFVLKRQNVFTEEKFITTDMMDLPSDKISKEIRLFVWNDFMLPLIGTVKRDLYR